MDLFTPVVPEERQHPNFRMPNSSPALWPGGRAVLEDWAEGFRDRDGKFVKEFQTTYNSSFWELYLFAAFKELGCKADLSHASPDFVLGSPAGEFIAEATIASHADGHALMERHDLEAVFDVDEEEVLTLAAIRLANAITAKHQKYQRSYAALPHVAGKPYVICVVPFEQPFFFTLERPGATQGSLRLRPAPLLGQQGGGHAPDRRRGQHRERGKGQRGVSADGAVY